MRTLKILNLADDQKLSGNHFQNMNGSKRKFYNKQDNDRMTEIPDSVLETKLQKKTKKKLYLYVQVKSFVKKLKYIFQVNVCGCGDQSAKKIQQGVKRFLRRSNQRQ